MLPDTSITTANLDFSGRRTVNFVVGAVSFFLGGLALFLKSFDSFMMAQAGWPPHMMFCLVGLLESW